MYKMKLLAMVFMLMAVFNTAYAQQAGSVLTNKGTVKGIARDTAQNYVLKSATVSIYKVPLDLAKRQSTKLKLLKFYILK